MANLNFKWGLHKNLPPELEDKHIGTLFFTKDEGGLYLGVEAGKKPQRIQGVVQYYADLTQFKSDVLPPYSSDVIYYIASENALVKWHNEKVSADGTIKEEGKFTILNVTASEFDSAVKSIAKNTSDISTNTDNINGLRADLGAKDAEAGSVTAFARIKQLENAVDALEELTGTGSGENSLSTRIANLESWRTTAEEQITSLLDDMAGVQSAAQDLRDDLGTNDKSETTAFSRIAALEEADTVASDAANKLAGRVQELEGTADAHGSRLDAAESEISSLKQDLATTQSEVANKAAASEVETLKGRVDGHDTNISNINDNIDEIKQGIADINTAIGDAANPAANTVYDAIKTNAANIAANDSAIKENADAIKENQENITDHEDRISEAETKIADIESANTEQGTAITDLDSRLNVAEDDITNLKKDAATNASNIQQLDDKFALYQTIADATSQHTALKTDLENQLTSHINAANALVYVGGIDSVTAWDTIKAQGSSVGKTYVISTSAITLTINGVQTPCYAGDLLIVTAAEGKSEVNGVLAADDIAWVHVKAGYNADLNDTLDVVDGDGTDKNKKATVRFSSYPAAHAPNEASRGDLGTFSIVSTSDNLDVTVNGENINIAMVWDTFDTVTV